MQPEDFLKIKKGDIVELPMTTTVAWFDRISNTMTFFVDARDAISIVRSKTNGRKEPSHA